MAEDYNDVLMKFVDTDGQAMPASCQIRLPALDPLLLGSDGFEHGRFFEVQDFDFSVGVDDTDAKVSAAKPGAASSPSPGGKPHPGHGKASTVPTGGTSQSASGGFSQFRYRKQGTKVRYPEKINPFQFKRKMDHGSLLLFRKCCADGDKPQAFKSASLVKRTITGNQTGMQAFLRVDFTDVLIISLSWQDDADGVKETCKFICRRVEVRYKPQLPDGRLGAVLPGNWSWDNRSAAT
jgi:type VI protein secretion system component Hcp